MKLVFGYVFDESHYTKLNTDPSWQLVGKNQVWAAVAEALGLPAVSAAAECLRIELYRLALQRALATEQTAFYANSFATDTLATAKAILSMRDDLAIAGWDFAIAPKTPARLRTLAVVEKSLVNFPDGLPEQYARVMAAIPQNFVPYQEILLYEPFDLLPLPIQRLFIALRQKGIPITPLQATDVPIAPPATQLAKVQAQILQQKLTPIALNPADTSLLIIKAHRENDAAMVVAQCLSHNPAWRPLCLIPDKNRTLDDAFAQANVPTMGILSSSAARPSLQLLKLATSFFWRPVDVNKLLEFVTLPLKPMAEELAEVIAEHLSKRPGIGESLRYTVEQYFDNLAQRALADPSINVAQQRHQFAFWFGIERYDMQRTMPIQEALRVYEEIERWAGKVYDEGKNFTSVAVLRYQAQQINILLSSLLAFQQQIGYLELERIVRTLTEPSPVQFEEAKEGHLPFVYHAGAIAAPAEQLLWWNCLRPGAAPAPCKWYADELAFLGNRRVVFTMPAQEQALQSWHQWRPLLLTTEQLVLVVPATVQGEAVFAHPVIDYLQAIFGDLSPITYSVESAVAQPALGQYPIPPKKAHTLSALAPTPPQLHVTHAAAIATFDTTNYTALKSLLYYPHQWVLKHKAKLRPSPIASIVHDTTLKGNLAHRFFEFLLQEDFVDFSYQDIEAWIDRHHYLLYAEGAPLLMYGKEPERVRFLKKLKTAAIALINGIKDNGWTVHQTEMPLEGTFSDNPFQGKADVVLQRGDEWAIIDIKWGKATQRRAELDNQEDLQLALYAQLLNKPILPYTAFFIVEEGKFYARSQQAFRQAIVSKEVGEYQVVHTRILERIQRTVAWRLAQLQAGTVEVRIKETTGLLDEIYGANMLDVLEMKADTDLYDDYLTLIKSW